MPSAALSLLLSFLAAGPSDAAERPFAIEVVDDRTGRGVPLVELKTVNGIRFVTDSNGIAAFREPGLMDTTVFFHVQSHGYEFPKDSIGYRGKGLKVEPGGSAKLAIRRINLAERLYRVTGEGIYNDSVLVGRRAPIRHPLLNGHVLGSDSVVNAIYHGKIRWFWGDTNRARYPLGTFHVPGAVSSLPGEGGHDPEQGVDLEYFVGNDGFVRPMAQMPGDGPTWIDGLFVLRDRSGRERMFAAYVKVRGLLDVYQRGLVEYSDTAERFEKVTTFADRVALYPGGHPFSRTVDGVEFIHFANPYPLIRVRADAEQLPHPERYEAFTCLVPGTRLEQPQIDRAEDGSPRYGWKANTPAVGPSEEAKLVKAGLLKPEETLLHLQDVATGKSVSAHAGSVYWNEYRKRWVMITVEQRGTSFLGEVWFAEADTPLGPWVYARKVVTHEKYSFYNPKQHPMLAKDGGRVIFFEGTYAQTFSGNPEATPRYDYNQVMYKLDLSDPALNLPVPIYRLKGDLPLATSSRAETLPNAPEVAFFALERPGPGAVPVFATKREGVSTLIAGEPPQGDASAPLFYALAADTKEPAATTLPLFEFVAPDEKTIIYSTDESRAGLRRAERPVCRVWRNPMRLTLPRGN